MTKEKQGEQLHCGHECVCNKYIDHTNTGATVGRTCNGETWCFKPCPHDTRNKPTAQQVPAPEQWIAGWIHELRFVEKILKKSHILEMIQAEKDNQSSAIITDEEAYCIAFLRWRGAYNKHFFESSTSLIKAGSDASQNGDLKW